jgi:hypothetical protein
MSPDSPDVSLWVPIKDFPLAPQTIVITCLGILEKRKSFNVLILKFHNEEI